MYYMSNEERFEEIEINRMHIAFIESKGDRMDIFDILIIKSLQEEIEEFQDEINASRNAIISNVLT